MQRRALGHMHAVLTQGGHLHEHKIDVLRYVGGLYGFQLLLLSDQAHFLFHVLLPSPHQLLVVLGPEHLVQRGDTDHPERHLGLALHGHLLDAVAEPEGHELPEHAALAHEAYEEPALPDLHLPRRDPVHVVPVGAEHVVFLQDDLPLLVLLRRHPDAQLVQELHLRVLEDGAGGEEVRVLARDDVAKPYCAALAAAPAAAELEAAGGPLHVRPDGVIQCHKALAGVVEEPHPRLGVLGQDGDHYLPREDHAVALRSRDDVRGAPLQEVEDADLAEEVVLQPPQELAARRQLHGPPEQHVHLIALRIALLDDDSAGPVPVGGCVHRKLSREVVHNFVAREKRHPLQGITLQSLLFKVDVVLHVDQLS
mmetsp:Transcript_42410/g.119962  ORF Transcript_42410/g.119962 Transcript_42410/m.119962 type:complete len:367 (-) Transcript_42410:558-1658(-)